MQGIVDSSWSGDILKRKFLFGFITVSAGSAITLNPRYHAEVVLSATEAEFVGIFCGLVKAICFLVTKRLSFQVRAICIFFFFYDKELKFDTFNYIIIGIKESSDKGLYDIYGYLQLKSRRWTNKDILNWLQYSVSGYLFTDRIFQRIEKEWKPHDVVLHIKLIADCTMIET